MKGSLRAAESQPFLKALGSPSLVCPGAARPPDQLRKKDLALLVYLRLERRRSHSRSVLSNLLWRDSTEEKARHSLSQALGRIRSVLGAECLKADNDRVEWRGDLSCDAALLQEMAAQGAGDPALGLYTGDFLAQFAPGAGAREFDDWADGRRVHLRTLALDLLDRAGERAEAEGDWGGALRIGERAVEIDPFWEHGHRRVMRAWHRLGERNRALRHYEGFATRLARELDEEPDPETQALAGRLRPAAPPSAAAPDTPAPPPAAAPETPAPPAELQESPAKRPATRGEDPAPPEPEPPSPPPEPRSLRARSGRMLLLTGWVFAGLAIAAFFLSRSEPGRTENAEPPPARRLPALGSPINNLADWLQTDGRWIYYRYERYMPGACGSVTQAVGNWGRQGWTAGLPIRCIDGAWLAVDMQPLLRGLTLAPQTTYCVNFLYVEDETSYWGQHGADRAPGLDSIRVVAPNGSYNIGFANVRDGRGAQRIVLTNEYPGPRC